MGATLKYVKEFEFPSSGKVNVKGYCRGGPVKVGPAAAIPPVGKTGAPVIAMKRGGNAKK